MNEGPILFGLRNGIQRWRKSGEGKIGNHVIIRRALVRGDGKGGGMKPAVEIESQTRGARRERGCWDAAEEFMRGIRQS